MELNTKELVKFNTHEHMGKRNNLGSGHNHYGTCGGSQYGSGKNNYGGCGSQYGSGHNHYGANHEHFSNCDCGGDHTHQRKYSDCHCGEKHSQKNQLNNCNNHSYENNEVEAYDAHPDTYSSCHEN